MNAVQRNLTKALLAALCGFSGALVAAGIEVLAPYARAVPPGQPNSAVFLRLVNTGSVERALIEASSPVAEVVELHAHRLEDGMMKMRQIDRIPVPPATEIRLAPGGLHIMLIGLKQPLIPDETIALRLRFDDGDTREIEVPVRPLAPPPDPAATERPRMP